MDNNLNETFRRNPFVFIQNHDLAVNPQVTANSLTSAGSASVDLVMADASITPKRVNIVKNRDTTSGPAPGKSIKAYYLPAAINQSVTLLIRSDNDFMFTPDLSGCLFAAYGPDTQNLTVEHVNVRDNQRPNLIGFRNHQILAAGHKVTFLLSPDVVPISPQHTDARVVVYNTGAVVIGRRNIGGGWQFIYRADGLSTQQVC